MAFFWKQVLATFIGAGSALVLYLTVLGLPAGEFLNFLTGALVLITGFYAWVTHGILRITQDQTEAFNRPHVTIALYNLPRNPIIYLKIANTGRTSANNLRLTIDQDFFAFGERKEHRNIANFSAFKEEIQSFLPGAELIFALAQGFVLFGDEADPECTPTVFNVTATYSYAGKAVTETTTVDLQPYFSAQLPPDSMIDALKGIREELKHIEHIKGELQRIAANPDD